MCSSDLVERQSEQINNSRETVILFTSDHGDFMGEHGMFVKGGVFYDLKKWLLNNSEDYGFYLTYNNNSFVKPDGR